MEPKLSWALLPDFDRDAVAKIVYHFLLGLAKTCGAVTTEYCLATDKEMRMIDVENEKMPNECA